MSVLSSELRNRLARVVTQAREVAEVGARVALESLAVPHHEPYRHMSPEERKLRNRLRAHGRHLGDRRGEKTGAQTMEHLVQECAYEHWHRMLFARFLAENHLLIEPEMNVPVTLEECEELAKEQGADQWTLASRFAQRMLPQVFRADHPVFEVTFAREHRVKLEGLLESLPPEVFKASDSLGWVYQFWQADKKEQVNRSEVKIGADELPAVTQLFTEPYMVQFLLHNSLGAWWVTRHPGEPCPVDLAYLRYAPSTSEGKGVDEKIPAAGVFDAWPNDLSKLKLLDPCCGSGHFLVAAFLMLVPMRMRVEGLSACDAVDAVLRDNLHGLEIDQRCIEIAAFALALEAWRYPDAGGYRPLPPLNLAWCGQPLPYKEDEWLKLANGDDRLRAGMHTLYTVFRDAPLLGSLIDPHRAVTADLLTADYSELRPLLIQALENKVAESADGYGGEQEAALRETAISAQGMALAADLLSRDYQLLITNVPYLTRGKQSSKLKEFCERRYSNAKNDLANVFLERCLELCREGGVTQIVMPQNWLFLTSYKKQRERLLREETWDLLLRLGEGGFESPMAAGAFTILLTLTHARPHADHKFRGLDASELRTAGEKAALLLSGELVDLSQKEQLGNPDAIVSLAGVETENLMAKYAYCYQGTSTGDNFRFVRNFWEVEFAGDDFELFQGPAEETTLYGGKANVVAWSSVLEFEGAAVRGEGAWGRKGIAIGQMRSLPATLFEGSYFSNSTPVIIPYNEAHLAALWCYCSSSEFAEALREINQKLSVDNGYVSKVVFDFVYWNQEAARRFPRGLPKPSSNDATQWVFCGNPKPASSPLQVAVARLLGYRWPAEVDKQMELSDDARAWIAEAKKLDKLADNDGIVCLAAIHGELPAHERLLRLLEASWGDDWNAGVLNKLLADADFAGKTLEIWLRDKFFEQHCALFHQRPFIWHVWDGLKDGFAALLNYHMLDRTNLERLIYSYLGDWIRMQEQAKRNGEDGAEERLAAAQGLKKRLEAILKGEDPLDIFVRWKPIEQQPIGWEPDLNDGVRLNIRPFVLVDDVGKKGAGILRTRPGIDWKKDRGKDVPDSPWYRQFKGERNNDWHLELAEKQAARRSKRLEN